MRTSLQALLDDDTGSFKLLTIGVLTLLLLIPLVLVEGVIEERSDRHGEVLREIARQHGGEQRLVGPLIAVPFGYRPPKLIDDFTGHANIVKPAGTAAVALILPEAMKAQATLAHDVRRRGIYEVPVFKSDIRIASAFSKLNLGQFEPSRDRLDWANASLILGVSDVGGISKPASIKIDGRAAAFEAGLPARLSRHLRTPGLDFVHAALDLSSAEDAAIEIEAEIGLNGSRGLYVAPVAGASTVRIAGDWPHPSFQGAPLPFDRQIDAAGFDAEWQVPALARGYGKLWRDDAVRQRLAEAAEAAVGFRHVRPDDFYVAATRAVKYGVVFVALTFLACFVLERLGGKRLHPAQYGLVGLSLALFYLLLIALAERVGLTAAYGLAAAAIVLLNGWYVGAALRSFRRGAIAGGALAGLYAAFYVMLASEDDALLIGAGLLLAGLALAMAATARLGRAAETTAA